MPNSLFLLWTLWFALGSATSFDCSITNVSYTTYSSETVQVNWNLTEGCPVLEVYPFQISISHLEFLACRDKKQSPKEATTIMKENSLSVRLTDLKPFSVYKVRIISLSMRKVEGSIELKTRPGKPQIGPPPWSNGSVVFVQAIKFRWSDPHLTCEQQNGTIIGYRVELWGVDSWVAQNGPILIDRVHMDLDVPQFYAQRLVPFTRYKLKVFLLYENGSGDQSLYNPEIPLEILEQTLPTTPKPPKNVKVTLVTADTVHLRWHSRSPPTGLVSSYVIRVGQVASAPASSPVVNWIRRLELLSTDNYCKASASGSSGHPSHQFCYNVVNLTSATTYHFQIQVNNIGVNDSSKFSESIVVTTDGIPQGPPTGVGHPSTEATTTSRGPYNLSSTAKITLIVISLILIVFFAVVAIAFYYKIKVRKLQMVYEQNRLQYVQAASANGSVLDSGYPAVTFSAGHVVILPRGNGAMTTQDYVQSVAHQIEEIQRRRLPEPPPVTSSSTAAPPSSLGLRRNHPDLLDNIRPEADIVTTPEDCIDMDGYLKPTFPIRNRESPQDFSTVRSNTSNPIAVASYASPNELDVDATFDRSLSTQMSTTSENCPLITSKNSS